MNFHERENAIGTLLKLKILPRYKRPDHMNDAAAQAELADMVSDLNAEWPIMSAERFADIGENFARALRSQYTSRSWPPIGVMVKALKTALVPPEPAAGKMPSTRHDIGETRRAQLARWCRGAGTCPDFIITRENLQALANEGVIQHREIEEMLAFASINHGISPEAESLRKNETLPGSLMVDDSPEGVRLRLVAITERLRGNGVSNPAFGGAK